jgi:hypothetical protein
MKLCQLVQELIGGQAYRQDGDLINLFPFLESRLKIY